jgi:hypothetical protein
MTQTIAHFVFTRSGAGCLVRALRDAGRDDQVVSTCHDLHIGPIDPSDPSSRAKWLETELGRIDRTDDARSERDWNETRFPGHRKVAWLTRRSAMEYAGFLDWLWHRGDTPCEVVDLSEVTISPAPELGPPRPSFLAKSLAWLHHDNIRHNKLWDLAEPLPMTDRLRYRDIWGRLIVENAPLRVIDSDKLVSAPIPYFDSLLMACVTDNWQPVSRIVGNAMAAQSDENDIDAEWLHRRLILLIESGRLEIQEKHSLENPLRGQVRLARMQ